MDSDGFSFFVLPGEVAVPEVSLNVDSNGEPLRKRAPHRKSRNGCGNCRRKKIKCDEKRPSCANCTKSKLSCDFSNRLVHLARGVTPSSSLPTPTSMASRCSSPIFTIDENLDHNLILRRSATEIELFRHFEKHTSKFLAMSRTIWSSSVAKAALQCDYLMESVVLIASAHINHYLPPYHANRKPELQYFSRALSSLQNALSREIASPDKTADAFDAILGCSFLVSQYCWTQIQDGPTRWLKVANTFHHDATLSASIKSVLIACQDVAARGVWWGVLGYSPKVNLERYIREGINRNRDPFTDLFRHCLFCGQGTRDPESASADNLVAAEKLAIPLTVMYMTMPNVEASGFASDIARFLFTWPSFCTRGYMQLVRERNMTAMTILLCYYAAILRMNSAKTWFMQKRAMFMYSVLRAELEGRCARCLKPALVLYDGRAIDADSQLGRQDVVLTEDL